MRKHNPLLARFVGKLGLPRSRLVRDLQYVTKSCLFEKILHRQTGTSDVRKRDLGLPGSFLHINMLARFA